jgi:hypothetical protein
METRVLRRTTLAVFFLCSFVFCSPIFTVSAAFARTTPHSAANARDLTVNALVISLDSKMLFNVPDLVSAPSSLLLLGCGLMSLARVVRKRFQRATASPGPRGRKARDTIPPQSAISPESAEASD